MDAITIEQAEYIMVYYSDLLTPNEKQALRHFRSTLKLEDAKDLRL